MSSPQQTVTIEQPILTPEQEQEKWLGEAIRNVRDKSALMKAAMKKESFTHVLRFASQMLTELRTGMLTPQHYYELYVKVFDELQALEMYLFDEYSRGRSLEDMYEVVQHAGNIVPRLYLLITVGSVYIKAKQAPPRELLKDLVEMCKGVQHPTRGLFLRHYLLTLTKNKLPDTGNEYDGEGGTVEDSANFILQNFKEMVWLWVRMESRNAQQAKNRREKERKELRILVGFNVVRLSQLDGIDKYVYQQAILPRILSIVLQYKEPLAQQYLLEVIIQVFPDEFHLLTLQELLQSLGRTVAGVDVHSILVALMDRLGNYVVSLREGTAEGGSKKEEKVIRNMFTVFKDQIAALAAQTTVFSANYAETQLSLLKLVLKTYPGEFDRLDEVLQALVERFTAVAPDADAVKVTRKLLQHLVDELKDINIVLDFKYFDQLIEKLPFKSRRDIALGMCSTSVNCDARVATLERVAKLFDIMAPIVKDVQDTPARKEDIYTIDVKEEFEDEQSLVCRVIHIIESDDVHTLFKMYSGIRKQLGQGGPERMKYTLKAMAFLYMRLAVRIKKLEQAGTELQINCAKPFQYIHSGDQKGILEILVQQIPLQAFHIYIACANAADVCELPDLCYDLYTEAFTIYEENAADTKEQVLMLNVMTSSLCALRNITDENYEVLATKVCQYSSKLLKKHDQSRMAAMCSHLFWKKTLSEEFHKKVLECMQRSLKLADQSQAQHQLPLFVELLNQFLHYYAAQTPGVTIKFIAALIDLIRQASASAAEEGGDRAAHDAARTYYRNTTKYIRSRQKDDERWQEIDV